MKLGTAYRGFRVGRPENTKKRSKFQYQHYFMNTAENRL